MTKAQRQALTSGYDKLGRLYPATPLEPAEKAALKKAAGLGFRLVIAAFAHEAFMSEEAAAVTALVDVYLDADE